MTETTAPDVRIPNVSPGAVSGLDHDLLSTTSQAPAADEAYDEPALPEVPEDLTTVDALLGWVNAEPSDEDPEVETVARAIAVLSQEGRDGRVTLVGPLESIILDAVLGAWSSDEDETPDDEPTDDPGAASVVTTGAGEAVSIEGTPGEHEAGPAVNADTGVVTEAGAPLPPIEGTGGTPLDPPQPGADEDGFGGDAPEPADPPAGD